MSDIQTKSGLTRLYNEKVVKVERMQRPMGSSSSSSIPGLPVPHQGVRVTTESGQQHLVHKGSGFGKSSQTVVTDAAYMSDKWKPVKHSYIATLMGIAIHFTIEYPYIAIATLALYRTVAFIQVGDARSVSGHSVGDFVKTGGGSYNFLTDNCIQGASRMTNLGHK